MRLLALFAFAASALFLVVACKSTHSLGEQCEFGCEGADCHPTNEPCDDGLYCSFSANVCKEPLKLGEACNPRCYKNGQCNEACADGLLCPTRSMKCTAPAGEGGECANDKECTTGFCNHGYRPEDNHLGECRGRNASSDGQPCLWSNATDGHSTVPVQTAGCAFGLVCVPPPPVIPTTSGLDVANACGSALVGCGYAGTCRAPGLGAEGSACVTNETCASGRCDLLKPPRGKKGIPGFDCGSEPCFEGPWPGICVAQGALVDNAMCDDKTCAPGYKCNLGYHPARCHALHSIDSDYCGSDSDLCAIGESCDGSRCR